ncbi:hypothetical protein CJ301_11865 [Limimaricola cinnabarinus]|uniref:Uncharacterized protein n=1 Tax=Limimaricola cinnabarinus TaxID=1125964 RepID=A0A2G1MEV8_9RHOB|nr:hypothetical protein CJ301_11865 [Limimaricola cinnabarinus]
MRMSRYEIGPPFRLDRVRRAICESEKLMLCNLSLRVAQAMLQQTPGLFGGKVFVFHGPKYSFALRCHNSGETPSGR